MPSKSLVLFMLYTTFEVAQVASTSYLPPPLPESEWVNKSHLNYTSVHDALGPKVLCMNIPVGVFGFYYYIAQIIMTLYAIIQIAREKRQHGICFLGSIVMCIYEFYVLIQQCRTVQHCSAYFSEIGVATIPGLWAAAWGQLGAISAIIAGLDSGEYWNRWRGVALLCYSVSWMGSLTPGLIYPLAIMQAGHIGYTQFLDNVRLSATLTTTIPVLCIMVPIIILTICIVDYKMIFSSFVTTLALLWCGASIVCVGKVIGSPWGEYWLRSKVGKLDVVWISFFPIFQSINTLVFVMSGGRI